MHARINAHFQTLGSLPERTQATAGDGAPLVFAEGFERVAAMLRATAARAGRILFIGNGGSAAIASHMATDFTKNGGLPAMAFNDPSLLTCFGNDFGYEHVFARAIGAYGRPGDTLVAISSSGRSPNILNGVEAARRLGCGVVTLSGFQPDNPLRRLGDVNLYVENTRYGFVEVCHLALVHAVLDLLMEEPQAAGPAVPATALEPPLEPPPLEPVRT